MLIVAYDGTNYNGWQLQPNVATIEGVLNDRISTLLKEDVHVIGASRTDAGVHAKGAVAVFDTDSSIPGEKFSFAINAELPDDIKIMSSREVRVDFHPRKTECRKMYCYSILNDTFESPMLRLYSDWVHGPLDEKVMAEGAKYLVGEHDFAAFCSVGSYVETTVRTIYEIRVERKDKLVEISVTGNGFLYNMVRIIAGTLISVGQGRIKPWEVKSILESKDRTKAGMTAPAKGLCLVGYQFEDEIFVVDK